MQPKITGIIETRSLGSNGVLTKAIQVTYTVGSFGPFTLTTNQTDLTNGTAMMAMQQFASTLANLPGVTPGT